MNACSSRNFLRIQLLLLLSALLVLAINPLHASELHEAVRSGDKASVSSLLAEGVNPNESDFVVGAPLHLAIAQGDREMVTLLVEAGVDLEAPSELNGARALHLAADFDEVALVAILLEGGADIEGLDGELRAPLHRAAEGGHNQIVALLLDRGANINRTEGQFGATPLQEAADNGHIETVKLLLDRGAEINTIDDRGFSALWFASQLQSFNNVGDGSLIELLVSEGADLSIQNDFGQTPRAYAESRGWAEIAEVLRRLEDSD